MSGIVDLSHPNLTPFATLLAYPSRLQESLQFTDKPFVYDGPGWYTIDGDTILIVPYEKGLMKVYVWRGTAHGALTMVDALRNVVLYPVRTKQ